MIVCLYPGISTCTLPRNRVPSKCICLLLIYGLLLLLTLQLLHFWTMEQLGQVVLTQSMVHCLSVILLSGTIQSWKRYALAYYRHDLTNMAALFWWFFMTAVRSVFIFCLFFSLSLSTFLLLEFLGWFELSHLPMAYWTLVSTPFYTAFLLLLLCLSQGGHAWMSAILGFFLNGLLWFLLQPWTRYAFIASVILIHITACMLSFCALLWSGFLSLCDQNLTPKYQSVWSNKQVESLGYDLFFFMPPTCILLWSNLFSFPNLTGFLSVCFMVSVLPVLVSVFFHPSMDQYNRRSHQKQTAFHAIFMALVFAFGQQYLSLLGPVPPHGFIMLLEVCMLACIQASCAWYWCLSLHELFSVSMPMNLEVFKYLLLLTIGPWLATYDLSYVVHLTTAVLLFQYVFFIFLLNRNICLFKCVV